MLNKKIKYLHIANKKRNKEARRIEARIKKFASSYFEKQLLCVFQGHYAFPVISIFSPYKYENGIEQKREIDFNIRLKNNSFEPLFNDQKDIKQFCDMLNKL